MSVRMLFALPLLAALTLASAPAFGQGAGKRADVGDVSKAVGGDTSKYYGPIDLPRPPQTDDGRDLVYMDPVFVTAIRRRRPARTYTFWPRLTMTKDATSSNFFRARALVRDAMMVSLAQIAQIDWPGDTKFDAPLASRAARQRVDLVLGGGKVDAIDFLYIQVQMF